MSSPSHLLKNMHFAKEGGEVRRFHTFPLIGVNNVAEHSFGVAWVCVALAGGPERCSKNLLLAALSHDLAEHRIGDVRADAKRRSATLKNELDRLEEEELENHGMIFELGAEESVMLKMADNLDGLMFVVKEISMGNRSSMVQLAFRNYAKYVREMISIMPESTCRHVADALLGQLITEAYGHGVSTTI